MDDYIKRTDALDIVADNNVKGKTMSDMAMKYEDWLRGCVYHDGRKGNVYLPCDTVLEIADWIEAHRDAVPVVRCRDCRWWNDGTQMCGITISATPYGHCHDGETWEEAERKDNE